MRDRAFGVELEFGTNDLGPEGVGDLLWANGFQEEWCGERREYSEYDYPYNDSKYYYTRIDEDGSEVELRSPILRGKKGFEELRKVVELLNKAGCWTDEADGLHVHHDAPEFINDRKLVAKLLKSWKYNEIHIAKFIDEGRADWAFNDNYSPCPTFPLEEIERYEKSDRTSGAPGWDSGFTRNNLNINALSGHGSIEFRFHEGTLNWEEIEAWIRFGQSFLNSVVSRANPIMPVDSPVVLLNRIRTNHRAKAFLTRKATRNAY